MSDEGRPDVEAQTPASEASHVPASRVTEQIGVRKGLFGVRGSGDTS
ncbi:NADH-quinone oxidoreductase subunit C, partial [Rhodococcus sp. WS4]